MPPHDEPLAQLTSREREVAVLVVQGLSSEEIAVRLDLSPHTVRKHRANLMARLGLQHRAQLALLLRAGDAKNADAVDSPNVGWHGH
jgi:DNA-binding CsgD family transcriptional regulator